MSNTDPSFNEKLKQYLIPHKAREHVALAVENDKRLRMWYPEPNNIEGGLLYRSVRARVDLDHPDGQSLLLDTPVVTLHMFQNLQRQAACIYFMDDVPQLHTGGRQFLGLATVVK